eukprot:4411145-Pleurochrysis_carterae.AAC.1
MHVSRKQSKQKDTGGDAKENAQPQSGQAVGADSADTEPPPARRRRAPRRNNRPASAPNIGPTAPGYNQSVFDALPPQLTPTQPPPTTR